MFLFLLPNHQFSWEGDNFQAFVPDAAGALDMLQRVTADEVITGAILVHHTEKHFLELSITFSLSSIFPVAI